MGNRWFARRYANEQINDTVRGSKTDRYTLSRSERLETEETIKGWNVGAMLAVLIPLFILFVAQMIQANKSGSRWRLWRGHDSGHNAVWAAYIWVLLLFLGLIWYGNRVAITDRASQNMRTLVGALFVFMNLCGILCMLVHVFAVRSGYQYKGANWLAQFPAFAFLSFLLMGVFAFIFSSILWRRLQFRTRTGAFDYNRDEDVLPTST